MNTINLRESNGENLADGANYPELTDSPDDDEDRCSNDPGAHYYSNSKTEILSDSSTDIRVRQRENNGAVNSAFESDTDADYHYQNHLPFPTRRKSTVGQYGNIFQK